jgi:hypothetical protein
MRSVGWERKERGNRQLTQPERAVDKVQRSCFGRHANRDLSREQSDRDRIRLRFSDEFLPSRPWKLDCLRWGPWQSRETDTGFTRDRESCPGGTYRDRFHRSCTTKMKVSQKLCVAMRNLSPSLCMFRGTRPTDRRPSKLMRLVLHPNVYWDIDKNMGYYERVATSEGSERNLTSSFVIS